MKIYSSYYAVAKHLPPEVVQVGISIVVPHWWNPKLKLVESRLAPDKSAFRKDNWRELYQQKMDRLAGNGILQAIVNRLPNNCVLLCYEKYPDECHRKLALEAMMKYCDVEGGEWEFPDWDVPQKNKKPDPEQPSLF